jgi:hypothetical protein
LPVVELDVLVPGPDGATRGPPGPGVPPALPDDCPITGLWPRSAAPAAVPLAGSGDFEFKETRAERLPPGTAGPLKTWPSVPSPVIGPLPVAAKSTAMIAAGIRMATSDAP